MPFNITPDPNLLYLSPTHREALQHLKYGIAEKKRFIVLTGEVGCGKTALCRHFINEIDDEKYGSTLILNLRITETQLLKKILSELGEEGSSRSRSGLVKQVNDVLLDRIQQGKDILLIIDEAQNLTFDLLEQLRLLSNLKTEKQKLLQIILMGQPEFKRILGENRLRQLRQRILVHTELVPLGRAIHTPPYRDGRWPRNSVFHQLGSTLDPLEITRGTSDHQQYLRQGSSFSLYQIFRGREGEGRAYRLQGNQFLGFWLKLPVG